MRILTWLLTHAAGLAVAAWLLDGISFAGPRNGSAELTEKIGPLLLVALIMGLVSVFVEPVVKLLSIPFILLTVGLFLLVINALMLMLSGWIADQVGIGFTVDGFWSALVGSVIITVVTWAIRVVIRGDR